MDSPASTSSSSDLYSHSEPVVKEVRSHPVHNGLSPRQTSQPVPEDSMSESVESRRSNTPQSIKGDREESLSTSTGGSTFIATVPNGHFPATHQKRKWDHNPVPGDYGKDQSHHFPQDHTGSQPDNANSSDSLQRNVPVDDTEVPTYDWSRNKRSKTGEHSSLPTGLPETLSLSSIVPAELWQYICCFVPPVFLGRLLRVNRAFNTCLTLENAYENHSGPALHSIVKSMSPQSIWAASRKRFCPGLPKPLRGLQELDMWRLLRGRNCQMCGETMVPSSNYSAESPWESGPGEKGVRIIWPFGIRSCSQCLLVGSEKEVNLLLSSSFPSFLLPGLPFALISSSNHFIANSVLRGSTSPPTLQLTKCYYKPHIEELKRQLDDVKDLGPASAEEWIKGLDGEGKERINDAMRWEQWEAKGGLKKVNHRPHLKALATNGPINAVPSAVNTKGDIQSERSTPQSAPFPTGYNGEYGSPAPSVSVDSPYSAQSFTSSFQPPWTAAAPFPDNILQRPQVTFQQPRPERSIRDVNEAKAARRAEIERRCAAMEPPLLPGVLGHMESFQAAIQISQPLTEQSWEVLKPRLLAQRPYAERKEQDRIQQIQMIQAEYKQRRQQEAQLKETKETFDREWDNVQTPVRNRLSTIASERIEQKWASGKSITKDTCPKFAADILLYVRQRYYEDIVREDDEAVAAGESIKTDLPNGPPTRTLILENMKWLFDTKIKPLTEHFQKELFLCNGCEGNFKFYGFEGVIQHYAAKHTTTLSMGSVVVHWRAEWPEHPPFNPNPSVAKAAYYKVPTPGLTSPQGPSMGDQSLVTSHGPYGQSTDSQAASHAYTAMHQSPELYQPPHTNQQQDVAHGPLPAQHYPQPLATNLVQPVQQSSTFPAGFPASQNAHNGFQAAAYNPSTQAYNSPFLGRVYPSAHPIAPQILEPTVARVPGPDFGGNQYGGASMALRPNGFQNHNLPLNSFEAGRNFPPQVNDLYKVQMDDMARHARDTWYATAGIKDIPQSVRIYVVIHHTASRFAARFTNEPSLAMFIDGIDHSSVMRPVRSLNGLACKTCVHTGAGTGERRLFTLPHLLNHFKNTHVENPHTPMNVPSPQGIPRLDWKTEMIELPDHSLIANLLYAQGMDNAKLELIAWALPGVFPSPLPRMGAPGSHGPVPIYRGDCGLVPRPFPPDIPSEPIIEPSSVMRERIEDQLYSRPFSAFRPLSQNTHSPEPPGEDEYDPHRPAFLGKIVSTNTSPGQPRKPARPSPTTNGFRSVSQGHRDESPYVMARHEETQRPVYSATPLRQVLSGDHGDRRFERHEHLRPTISPKEPQEADLGGRREEQDVARSIREAYENMRSYDGATDPDKHHLRVSDLGKASDNGLPVKTESRTQSPNEGVIKAADQFLNSLGRVASISHGNEVVPSRNGSAIQSAPRKVESSQDRREEHNADQSVQSYRWESDNINRDHQDNELPLTHIRTGSLASRDDKPNPLQRPTSNTQYSREYRSSSHMQVPLKGNRLGTCSPALYAPYEPPQPAVIYRPDVADHPVRKSRSKGGSIQTSKAPRYRTRSRSPQAAPIETTYYRARTPMEEPRHEAIYRVRSPPQRIDGRYHKVSSYDYAPQERYEYVEDRGLYEDPYRQRVEYVPVRLGEHDTLERGRYVIAQPLEPRPSPEYVRIERGYGEEPLYERNSQRYHEPPRAYQVLENGEAPQPIHGYRY